MFQKNLRRETRKESKYHDVKPIKVKIPNTANYRGVVNV